MTKPDPTAVREAASRLVSNWHYNYGHPKTTFAKKSERLVSDVDCLADAYLALTDPAPLTVERLAEMGFVVKSAKLEVWFHKGGLLLAHKQDEGFSFSTSSMAYVWPNPRTVGELTQLLRRLEKR